MFCPKCRVEFREGFSRCVECGVDLVYVLPPENMPDFVNLKEVISCADGAQVAFIKSIFEGEKIPYHAQGDQISLFRTMVPVRFLVPKEYIEKAKELIKDLL